MNRSTSKRTGLAILAVLALLAAGSAVSQGAITSPLDIPGHVLWLDANDIDGDGVADTGTSGMSIASWTDKSSGLGDNTVTTTNGNPTQHFGVQNGNNVARFVLDSQDKLDNAAFNVSGNYSVFTVVSPATGGRHVLSGLNEPGVDAVLYTGGPSWRFYDGTGVDAEVNASADTGFHLFGVQIDPTDDSGFFDSMVTSGYGWGAATLNGIRIGNLDRDTPSSTNRAEAWGGDIAEVVIYDRSLSLTERESLSGYLSMKWGLNLTFPTGAMTEIERGHVTGGAPSTLLPSANRLGNVNVALNSAGGVAFAQDEIGGARDFRPHRTNDGEYSDAPQGPAGEEPWIGALHNTFVGVKLDSPSTIDQIGFQNEFPGRRDGQYVFQYTTDSFAALTPDVNLGFVPAEVAALNWQVLDVKQVVDLVDTRHLYGFDPIHNVTGVRVVLAAAAGQIGIAELEVFSGASTAPGDVVVVESIDTAVFDPALNSDSFNFATIGRPSATDYADQSSGNGVVVSVAAGSAAGTHGNSAAVTALNDGVIMDANIDCCDPSLQGPNGQRDAFFFQDSVDEGRVLMTMPELVDVEKIVTFAGIDDCCLNRGEQNYTVFGTSTANPDTSGDLFANPDWQPIATVHAGPENQTAIEISNSGGSLGVYRHLLWDIDTAWNTPWSNDGIHDFFGEFDVYATPIPEPSSWLLAMLGLALTCLLKRRR